MAVLNPDMREMPNEPTSRKPTLSLAPRVSFKRVGNQFGPYRLIRTLGEGEFGKVKLAVHEGTGQEVKKNQFLIDKIHPFLNQI